ncbi:transposase [Anaerospora hongkongensis]|uniref:transposase n=1 Tax=Anaerospora hongkongensis TaxID=244830 RepID=UPI0028A0F6EA|nr:transposase [Anaerospora hongkongensis]
MSRQARVKSVTGIYHVILRGINKQNVFDDHEDKKRFIDTLLYYKRISGYEVYSYCLMDNHIHLLIREKNEFIAQIIKRISSSYVYWYNQRYDRCGHLFQERFKSEAVESNEYLLTVLRYIHQNPVKAGITKNLEDYLWSSYDEYIGNPRIVDTDFPLSLFSEDKVRAIDLFKGYIKEKSAEDCLEYKWRAAIADADIIGCLRELGFANGSDVQKLNKNQRDDVIKKMKEVPGITIRQLARITGITKSSIGRI